MPEPIAITLKQARNSLLWNQRLIEPAPDPLSAMASVVAVQTQYAASLPGSLFARTKSYKKNWHEKALVDGSAVKSWTLRHTVHTSTNADHVLLLASMGISWRNRVLRWAMQGNAKAHLEIEKLILEALQDKPLTRRELHAMVPILAGIPGTGWGRDVKGLAYAGELSFANNDGVTRFRLHPAIENPWTQETASAELMRRYFQAYGPATLQDFRYWSSMSAVQTLRTFKAVESELAPVLVEGLKGNRFVYGPIMNAEASGVKLLPKFDALALAHRDKSMFFDARTAKLVFRIAGQIEALVLAGDSVVGTWRIKRGTSAAQLTVDPFKPLGKRVMAGIEREAARMAKPFGIKEVQVSLVSS